MSSISSSSNSWTWNSYDIRTVDTGGAKSIRMSLPFSSRAETVLDEGVGQVYILLLVSEGAGAGVTGDGVTGDGDIGEGDIGEGVFGEGVIGEGVIGLGDGSRVGSACTNMSNEGW